MNYRQIIAEAWHFTQENKKLIVWYAFVPSFLGTLVGAGYLVYQYFAFLSSGLFENWPQSFTVVALRTIGDALKNNIEWAVPLLILAIIIALMYLFLPVITEGAMIQMIARKKGGQDVKTHDGIKYGMFYFLTLFRYSLLAKTFSIISIFSWTSFILRNLGPDTFGTLLPLIILLAIISIIFGVLFVFVEYYIVIDDNNVTQSMAKSSILVYRFFGRTIMITILMFVIGIRILLQIVFVLLVPIGVVTGIYYLAASTVPAFGFIIGGLLGVAALVFASYLGAIVHVFATTTWVFAFLDVTTNPEINARGDAVEMSTVLAPKVD